MTARRTWLQNVVFLVFSFWVMAAAAEVTRPQVATVTPIAHSLAASLLKGTEIEVVYLPPPRLPVNRVASWLRKNRSNKFASYDALLSISDAVPEFAFSHTLRQSNIRLVTIDIAYARLPEGEKVVLRDAKEFFWLNSNNLLLMLGVARRDLTLMWPTHRQRIQDNFQRISAVVRKLNLGVENALFAGEIVALTFSKPSLQPLAGSLSLDIMTLDEVGSLQVPALLVGNRKPRAEADLNSLRGYWQIDDLSRFSKQPLEARMQANLKNLQMLFE
ncbi:MAG: hypothetical protein AAF529_00340 [Pseudomonadota bacterium]